MIPTLCVAMPQLHSLYYETEDRPEIPPTDQSVHVRLSGRNLYALISRTPSENTIIHVCEWSGNTQFFGVGFLITSSKQHIHPVSNAKDKTITHYALNIGHENVDDIVTVSEEAIVAAMRELWEKLHIVVEPSAAVPYAALLEQRVPLAGRRIGLLVTGGNADLDKLPWLKT